MAVAHLIHEQQRERQFSFEVLPPLKGTGTERLFSDIEKLCELHPAFINITTHHSEYVYKELSDGRFERQRLRRPPRHYRCSSSHTEAFRRDSSTTYHL